MQAEFDSVPAAESQPPSPYHAVLSHGILQGRTTRASVLNRISTSGSRIWLAALPPSVPSSPEDGCMQHISRFIRNESGQDVVEYGLLIATIAIVVLVGVGIFGGSINTWFQSLAGRITTVGT